MINYPIFQVSVKATCNGKIIGILMNKIAYKEKKKDIDGFAEVLAEDKKNFMWPILELVDKAYEVSYECSVGTVDSPNSLGGKWSTEVLTISKLCCTRELPGVALVNISKR